ncbi:tRNA lysidine(34) synthetase TilS [Nocardioides mangrovicus]|uniref:tRNA(Ile)-lysidine synthase n=1 Tax=Nocardioides mangrovicus TaxID=2478913 RepID=A0A3L8P735_9ACTN|nr:tRNA lysidine(34) synthetase TilS [Nocardioides mangrovicus]RLV50439.1 tRNA lysidine(34) synthetase TilS [Nocardioides mangrovicus]
MAGPHPSVAAVRLGVRRVLAQVPDGATVLVACSGGADSLALLAAAIFERRARAQRVVGVTVDHGLQPGSRERAEHVVQQMAALGADETASASVTVDAAGLGPEAAARQARYDVLQQLAQHFEADLVLLGHTLDDQAETVLLGLTRGSGGRSLAGMRRGFDRFRRPLLDVGRADTETACQVEGIEFWSDPHNTDDRFTRSRVRSRVMPVLEDELGPGVAATLARTADQLRADTEYLDEQAERLLHDIGRGQGPQGLPVEMLRREHDAIRRRVIRLAALAAGSPASELFHEHVVGIDALVTDWHGQRGVDLPGHLRAVREDDHLRFVDRRA